MTRLELWKQQLEESPEENQEEILRVWRLQIVADNLSEAMTKIIDSSCIYRDNEFTHDDFVHATTEIAGDLLNLLRDLTPGLDGLTIHDIEEYYFRAEAKKRDST